MIGSWSSFVVRLLLASMIDPALGQDRARALDDFENATDWTVVASNQVSGALRSIDGVAGRALCLDYDFNGATPIDSASGSAAATVVGGCRR